MNAKEFYKHITEHMTPEEALLKLLEGHVRTYEKLKFPEGEELHPVMVATMAAVDMGWTMAIPASEEDEEVRGIIMGTQEYVEEMLTEPKDKEGCGCENGCSSSDCQNR
jgi:hypothetical protein